MEKSVPLTDSHAFAELHSLIEPALEGLLTGPDESDAVHYAMFSGGKRIRPVMTLLAAEACGGRIPEALPAACAIEFLHCASLIWDDLPSMDNASERRGRPPVHVVFGEGVATLAALSLLNRAYAIFGREKRLIEEAEFCIAQTIAGQAADLRGGQAGDHRKTTGLMRLTLTAGAIACRAPHPAVNALAHCGDWIGEAYQMLDDFEDGDAASPNGARERLLRAQALLSEQFGSRAGALVEVVRHIASRRAGPHPVAA
jgi:geranylgeranyl diphosphate synthase type II